MTRSSGTPAGGSRFSLYRQEEERLRTCVTDTRPSTRVSSDAQFLGSTDFLIGCYILRDSWCCLEIEVDPKLSSSLRVTLFHRLASVDTHLLLI